MILNPSLNLKMKLLVCYLLASMPSFTQEDGSEKEKKRHTTA